MPSDWSWWSSSTSSGYYSTEGFGQAVWSLIADSVEEILEEEPKKEKQLGFFDE